MDWLYLCVLSPEKVFEKKKKLGANALHGAWCSECENLMNESLKFRLDGRLD